MSPLTRYDWEKVLYAGFTKPRYVVVVASRLNLLVALWRNLITNFLCLIVWLFDNKMTNKNFFFFPFSIVASSSLFSPRFAGWLYFWLFICVQPSTNKFILNPNLSNKNRINNLFAQQTKYVIKTASYHTPENLLKSETFNKVLKEIWIIWRKCFWIFNAEKKRGKMERVKV